MYGTQGTLRIWAWRGWRFESSGGKFEEYASYAPDQDLYARIRVGMGAALSEFANAITEGRKPVRNLGKSWPTHELLERFYAQVREGVSCESTLGRLLVHPPPDLDEGVCAAAAFGFCHVDVGVGGLNGHLSPVEAASQPDVFAAQVRQATDACGVVPNECFTLNFGPLSTIRMPQRARRHAYILPGWRACSKCRFAAATTGARASTPRRAALADLAVEAFKPLVELAGAQGVRLHVETDCESCAKTPQAAEELCERVPGLKLTLTIRTLSFWAIHRRKWSASTGIRRTCMCGRRRLARSLSMSIRGPLTMGVLCAVSRIPATWGCSPSNTWPRPEADEAGVNVAVETWRMAAALDEILSSTAA